MRQFGQSKFTSRVDIEMGEIPLDGYYQEQCGQPSCKIDALYQVVRVSPE